MVKLILLLLIYQDMVIQCHNIFYKCMFMDTKIGTLPSRRPDWSTINDSSRLLIASMHIVLQDLIHAWQINETKFGRRAKQKHLLMWLGTPSILSCPYPTLSAGTYKHGKQFINQTKAFQHVKAHFNINHVTFFRL